ncbi:hypothetical protein D3C80_1043660 [compost metagenome]
MELHGIERIETGFLRHAQGGDVCRFNDRNDCRLLLQAEYILQHTLHRLASEPLTPIARGQPIAQAGLLHPCDLLRADPAEPDQLAAGLVDQSPLAHAVIGIALHAPVDEGTRHLFVADAAQRELHDLGVAKDGRQGGQVLAREFADEQARGFEQGHGYFPCIGVGEAVQRRSYNPYRQPVGQPSREIGTPALAFGPATRYDRFFMGSLQRGFEG